VFFHAPLDPRQFASRDALQEAVRTAIASGLTSDSTTREIRAELAPKA